VTASDEQVESQWGRLIVADDVAAAFGRPVKRTEILEIADEAIGQFSLKGTPKTWVMVVLKDHQFLGGGVDRQGWWPADDLARALDGVGDEAYVTRSGGLVARLGDRWTAGVRADVDGGSQPDGAEPKDLLRRVLQRTKTDADQWGTVSGEKEPVSILVTQPFRAGPRRYNRSRRLKQVGFVIGFAVLTLFCAAVAHGLYGESGGPALFGKSARAKVVGECTGFRAPMCPVVILGDGDEPDLRANYFPATVEPDKGDVVDVRYRDGKAIPDSLLAMIGSLLLVAAFAIFAVLSLGTAVALLEIWHSRTVARIALYALLVAGVFAMLGVVTRYVAPLGS